MLGVSKRCCPACGKLVELIREGQRFGEKLIAPGKHSKWSGVALPPWLHRKYAEPILAYAKNVLRDRFKLIIQEQQENDLKRTRGEASLSAESTGIGEESPAAVRKKARECRSKFPSVGFSPTKLGRQEDSSGYINEDKS